MDAELIMAFVVAVLGSSALSVAVSRVLSRQDHAVALDISRATLTEKEDGLRRDMWAEIHSLGQQIIELRKELQNEREKNDELAELIESRTSRLADVERREADCRSQLALLQTQMVAKDMQLSQMETQIQALTNEVSGLRLIIQRYEGD